MDWKNQTIKKYFCFLKEIKIKYKKAMSNRKIRNFSAEQKTKIVLEILESEKTLAEISKQYEVKSKTLQNWKKQFLEDASLAFEPAKVVSEYKKEIEWLKEQNDALAKALGKSTIERDWAVGKLDSLDISNKRSLVDSKLKEISMARQCELLCINRSMLYYTKLKAILRFYR